MSDNSSSAIASSGSSTDNSGDQVNDNVVGVPVPSSSHENSFASGSGALTNVTIAPKEQTSDFSDTCTWYANTQCYMPRNCYDCINVALRRDECAVDPRGMCVSMSTYRRYTSMQSNASNQDFSGYFPAANFTYCNVMDATCSACKTKWREQYWSTGQSPAPAICRGDDGCICISSCEMPNRVESIIMEVCTLMGFDTTKLATVAYVGAAMIAAIILSVIGLRAYTKKRAIADRAREEQERLERLERRRQLLESRQRRTGPPLALNAWNSLRDKLLESEREFIQGGKPSLAELGVQTTQAIGGHEQVLDGEGGGRDGEEADSIRYEGRRSSRRSRTDL